MTWNVNNNRHMFIDDQELTVLELVGKLKFHFVELGESFNTLSNEVKSQLEYLLGVGLYETVKKRLEEMKNNGELAQIINDLYLEMAQSLQGKEDKLTTMEEVKTSIVPNKLKDLSYQDIENAIDLIGSKFSNKVTTIALGKSVLNRNIRAVVVGNANCVNDNKMLVFAGHHSRESHGSTVILKQIEFICSNWDKLYLGEKISDIFKNSCIIFVPNINVDGLELCRLGINSIPSSDTARIQNIKQAVEDKFKVYGLLKDADITADHDLYNKVVWTGNKGIISDYVFRNQDCSILKCNANGIDLHYNAWQDGLNGDYMKAYASMQGFPTSFASENYIGQVGFADENALLLKLIDDFKLGIINSYHGRGPTVYWNFKQTGKVASRHLSIVQDLADISKTPYSESSNGAVGFCGWFYSKYNDPNKFCSTREIGWAYFPVNEDNNYWDTNNPVQICPLPNEQLPYIWNAEKYTMIHLLKKFVRKQDVLDRYCIPTQYDFTSNILNNNMDSTSGQLKTSLGLGLVKLVNGRGSYTRGVAHFEKVLYANGSIKTGVHFDKDFKITYNVVGSDITFNVVSTALLTGDLQLTYEIKGY